MGLKNRKRPEIKTEPVTNILRGHPEEIISKSIESLKKTRHYRGRVPTRGREGRGSAMRNRDGVQGG